MAKGKILAVDDLPPKMQANAIENLTKSAESIYVYSPEEFSVKYGGGIVTIKKGFHPYAPSFAVWAVVKYGPSSIYGKTFRTVKVDGKEKQVPNPVLLDYDPEAGNSPSIPKSENRK
jgi:hypothetical protein